MVNTGKPSKGCENCRSRKIRCDQTRPAYWEGTQSNRECLGYRDETESVAAQKAHSFQSSSAPSTLSSSSRRRMPSRSSGTTKSYAGLEDPDFNFGSDRDHNLQMLQARQSPVQTHPNTTVSKQEAICFFLQSHAIPSKFVISEILINFLMDSSGSPGQRAIQSSIIAVASAMLSRVRKMPSLRQAALQEYGSTLNLVNQALANVEEAKTDQTLGAVVLLALYEIVVSSDPEGIGGWKNHICGAAALLKHRGAAQWRSENVVRLFLRLRYQIIIACLQHDVPVPSYLLECTKLDMIPQINNSLSAKIMLIIGHLSNLCANMQTQALTDPKEILTAACAIEADLIAWLAALPPDFIYSSHTIMPLDHSFERYCHGTRPYNNEYHMYRDIEGSNCWNHYRCVRILVSELILSQFQKISKSLPTSLSQDFYLHCKSLRSTIRRLGADICRSFPFNLGACNSHVLPEATIFPPRSYLGGFLRLWPLFIASMVEGPTHPQLQWVIQCLRMIGNTWGLAQALAVMDLLIVNPGMLNSVERYGESADTAAGSSEVLSFSICHVPYYDFPALKKYREVQASSA